MREAVIVSAVRTPVGKARGCLASVPAWQLGTLTVKEAVKRAGIDPNEIDEIIFGNLLNTDCVNIARVIGLAAGLPISVPGITINRQCASGINAIAYAAALIQAGYGDVIVAGGVESDSNRCYIMEKPTAAYQPRPPSWVVPISAPKEMDMPMGITAENLARKYHLTREECDQFALESHQKAAKAWQNGYFDQQIVPVSVKDRKGNETLITLDEPLRPDCNLQSLAKLPPAFERDGIVTAGNSSPMSDGSGAVVVMERKKAQALGLKIWAKFSGFASVGVDPSIMGIGPVYATRKLLKKLGMNLSDIDLIEMNEAFAAQSLACIRELNMDTQKLNVNGGALALGHPLAGTGGILAAKLVYELERRDLSSGLITFCAGGGQGFSALLERI
ncbi:acetyl-CoA C-acetyltransferase [Mesocricetibacter intestinalis]|uniref:Acetyl-CoA C-acetyltransferase n=1 Tax=Mesocricetibacter intestinalis TaxID=1521930 RepID=A0A4R6VB65_9PAST|nr:thiolase family protein [Mesocricetibacter intestinalis]TDQ56820.1 acetyl-CoA C-acetyltransferase [Mesocricetibacter intestinalis]